MSANTKIQSNNNQLTFHYYSCDMNSILPIITKCVFIQI